MRRVLFVVLIALLIISGCAPSQESASTTLPASIPVPDKTPRTIPTQNPEKPSEDSNTPTKTTKTSDDALPLYPEAIRDVIPDKLHQSFIENKIVVSEGYLVQAAPDDIMNWYREHMPGWELQNEAKPDTFGSMPGIQVYRKDSQGILLFAQGNLSKGKTLLVLASGGWPNIECCGRQFLEGSGGDGGKDEPVPVQVAATPLMGDAADDIVIIANPINLDQIEAISKFRSGAGHWYSTSNYLGEPEPPSSMKHYVQPLDSERDKAEVYAPFDGEIVNMGHVERGPGIDGGWQFFIEQRPYKGWVFGFCHVNTIEGLTVGSQVKAGEFLGYAMVEGGNDFDLSLQGFKESGVYYYATQETLTSNLDSIFNHMNPEVYKEFVDYGFTREIMIISREYRKSHPLKGEGEPNTTHFYFISETSDPFRENFILANKPQK